MKTKILFTAAIVFMGSASVHAGSCYQRDTFGDAFKSARDNQILHHDSRMDLEPVSGFDGPAAQKAYMGYIDSFGRSGRKGASGSTVQFVPLVAGPDGMK